MDNQIHTVVLCLRSGGDFNFSDVELLSLHLHKHWDKEKGELRVLCLYDKIDQPWELANVTLIPTFNKTWPGWWIKMNLFNPLMDKYRPFLYLDLDTAIVGSLNDILPPMGYENEFIGLSGFFQPDTSNGFQSGIMWFPEKNENVFKVWCAWVNKPEESITYFQDRGGDQAFIRAMMGKADIRWQQFTNKICSFKINPTEGLLIDGIPENTSIVCFHGQPRIPQAAIFIDWVQDYLKGKSVNIDTWLTPKRIKKLKEEKLKKLDIKEAWVINLDSRKDRLDDFNAQKFPFTVQRFPACSGKTGEAGCKASHLSILKKEHSYPFIVFEDDAYMIKDWAIVEKAFSQLPEDWDMLFLGAHILQPLERYSKNLFRLKGAWCAHAIIYGSSRVIEYTLANENKVDALDVLNKEFVFEQFNCFITYPMVCTQKKSFSNITGHQADYSNFLSEKYSKFTE